MCTRDTDQSRQQIVYIKVDDTLQQCDHRRPGQIVGVQSQSTENVAQVNAQYSDIMKRFGAGMIVSDRHIQYFHKTVCISTWSHVFVCGGCVET